MKTFTSSGFQAVSKVRAPTPSLSEYIRKVTQGSSSGVLLVWLAAIAGALSYEVRWVAVPAGTTIPAAPAWTSLLVPSVHPPITVSNLTPGTNYHFEVRVLTKSGWSDWGGFGNTHGHLNCAGESSSPAPAGKEDFFSSMTSSLGTATSRLRTPTPSRGTRTSSLRTASPGWRTAISSLGSQPQA